MPDCGLELRRVAATAAALDALRVPDGTAILRVAPDEAIVLGSGEIEVADPDAFVLEEGGLSVTRMNEGEALALLGAHADWQVPPTRPAFAQGLLAGIPVKLWLPGDGTALLLASRSLAAELDARLEPRRTPPPAMPPGGPPTPHRDFVERRAHLSFATTPRTSYDVVIVGGGGHGLATAYYLAKHHGITNVAVVEKGYIGGGQLGPQHDGDPLELRDPGGGRVLPAQRRPLRAARGRDRTHA